MAGRLALVGAGHDGLFLVDAEMVRPEPHQPLDKPDFGVERRVDPRSRFGAKQLPGQRNRFRLGRRRLHLGLRGVAGLALLISVALGVVLEDGAVGGPARRQVGVGNLPCSGPIQLGNNGAARIGCDRFDRSGARATAKPMQSKRRLLRIASHLPNLATAVCPLYAAARGYIPSLRPAAGRVMSSQPSGVTVTVSPGRRRTVVIDDSTIAGPAILCLGAKASKS